MLVIDLDGNKSDWKIKGREVVLDHRHTSFLHKSARTILKSRFPTMQILEEVPIKVRKKQTLYLDFYIPLIKLAIEVHGEQHFSINSKYHNSRHDFIRQIQRDNDKMEWCEINGIKLIVLAYNNQKEWEELLK